jgi:hypothetical protein
MHECNYQFKDSKNRKHCVCGNYPKLTKLVGITMPDGQIIRMHGEYNGTGVIEDQNKVIANSKLEADSVIETLKCRDCTNLICPLPEGRGLCAELCPHDHAAVKVSESLEESDLEAILDKLIKGFASYSTGQWWGHDTNLGDMKTEINEAIEAILLREQEAIRRERQAARNIMHLHSPKECRSLQKILEERLAELTPIEDK